MILYNGFVYDLIRKGQELYTSLRRKKPQHTD